jgi:N-acetylneuraminic acid mutarotase
MKIIVASFLLLAATLSAFSAPPGVFSDAGSLSAARSSHTATLLANGQVLVAGGLDAGNKPLASAELYDPALGAWTPTAGTLNTARFGHTATLLANGQVLVAGGGDASAELYDPALGTWTPTTGALHTAHYLHTATLLANGQVLVAGGLDSNGNVSASAELYDPALGTWTPTTGALHTERVYHTATLLASGQVLVAGGFGWGYSGGGSARAELYDPALGTWTPTTGTLAIGRAYHTATLLANGQVLVAGGGDASAELYDPALGTWTPTTGTLNSARRLHTATLLANGQVLVAGGQDDGVYSASAELYDPAHGTWTPTTGTLNTARLFHTATLLANGQVLVAGGLDASDKPLASAELYDPARGAWTSTAGTLSTARANHTATLLANGQVLVAGGGDASSELYDPALGTWTPTTGTLNAARGGHTATLLANGQVLVAGGGYASSELYDPARGTWTPTTGPLKTARYQHTATLLANGQVLVAGGDDTHFVLASAELYDPALGTWTPTAGTLNTARFGHTATLLANGKVLVAGGYDAARSHALASAELYDPALGTWTPTTGTLNTTRVYHTATLLANGQVLVAGGVDARGVPLAGADLYDPTLGTWTPTTGPLKTGRYGHTATLLANGQVLVAGGYDVRNNLLTSAELYDPALGTWTPTTRLNTARHLHTATLLANGRVLAAGGTDNTSTAQASVELYSVGLGFDPAWQPQITSATSPLVSGAKLVLSGTRFRGISGASGGNTQDSSSNYPVVQLMSLGNGQTRFLLSDPASPWSDTAFRSLAVTGFPVGYARATVFTNGIPSPAALILVTVPPPAKNDFAFGSGRKAIDIDVLANDGTHGGGTITIVSPPAHGTATVVNGKVHYVPTGALPPTGDSFTYQYDDGHGGIGTATVRVENFAAFRGNYDGLITNADTAHDHHGYLRVASGRTGTFSASLILGGLRTFSTTQELGSKPDFHYVFTGSFDSAGNFLRVVPHPPQAPITLKAHLDAASSQITGTIESTGLDGKPFTSQFATAPRVPAGGRAESYTLLLVGPSGVVPAPAPPAGTSFAAGTITTRGNVRLRGRLADGTPFASASYFHADETFAVYTGLYAGGPPSARGSLRGTIAFSTAVGRPAAAASGTLTWFKPLRPADDHFPGGFTATSAALISHYVNRGQRVPILDFGASANNGGLNSTGGGLTNAIDQTLTVHPNSTVTVTLPNGQEVGLRFSLGSGLFKGSFLNPMNGQVTSFRGAVFQDDGYGSGFFLGASPTDSGAVSVKINL